MFNNWCLLRAPTDSCIPLLGNKRGNAGDQNKYWAVLWNVNQAIKGEVGATYSEHCFVSKQAPS